MRKSNKRKEIEGEVDNNAAGKWKTIEKKGNECVARDLLALHEGEEWNTSLYQGGCNQTEKLNLKKF